MRIRDWSSDVCSSDLSALAQDVKIGIVGGISGPIAALAPPMIQASKMAVEHVNAQGGILDGRKLVAVVGDSACSQQGGTDAAAKAVNVEHVRSEGGRVGKECGSPCRTRWSP